MSHPHSLHHSPLSTRYASRAMSELFSMEQRTRLWRQLWVALARAEGELGLPITDEQIAEMSAHIDTADLERVNHHERRLRHDVMAHVHAFGEQSPKAKGIIHLGATSCYVTDNGDLLQMSAGLRLLQGRLIQLLSQLRTFCEQYKSLPCLSYTHMQPAQPTTLGKRAATWLQDFLLDYEELALRLDRIRFLGVKGTTGTQASFLDLFDGDTQKVEALDKRVAELMGFSRLFTISGQTYTRKQDQQILDSLTALGVSAHKMATDLRLLAHLKEVEEPFAEEQIGSSAMPYKRNPMASERVCSLARYLMSLASNPRQTAALQWLERTLDDSANRRIVLADAFLTADALLVLLLHITRGLVVYPKMIHRNLMEELPFLATERLLMRAVQSGGDRQEVHERIRQHSLQAARHIKEQGGKNDLLERLASDQAFCLSQTELEKALDPKEFIGCAPQQVSRFLAEEVDPVIEQAKMNLPALEKVTI